jgi:hypothetical protein
VHRGDSSCGAVGAAVDAVRSRSVAKAIL